LRAALALSAEPSPEGIDFFERKIRPLLADHCYKCHSASAEKLKGGLLVDTQEGLRKGGESGSPALVPGDAERSLLIKAVRYRNEDLQMPPPKEGKLTEEQIADLVLWVNMGAPDPRTGKAESRDPKSDFKSHWSFQPPKDHPLPVVRNTPWPRTPVDHFILARLETRGLTPAPPADKRTLIRRVYLDLIGLPPTAEEVDAFLADDSPDAFARVVERLLASPHYGERWGRYWLDVARYSDTKGYVYTDREEGRFVHSHAYRDWVIRAFNEDMPYDRFLRLQIAADQMNTDRRDLAAMGFLTLGRRFLGIVHDIIDDRLDTLMRGTQGLTISCARCHDHKFDPIPTRDYYSLYGVFAGCSERAVSLDVNPKKTDAVATFQNGLREREAKLEETFRKKSDEVADRVRAKSVEYLTAVLEVEKFPTEEFYAFLGPNDLNPMIARQWDAYLLHTRKQFHPVFALWHELAALPAGEFAAKAPRVLKQHLTTAGGDSVREPAADSPPEGNIAHAPLDPPPSTRAAGGGSEKSIDSPRRGDAAAGSDRRVNPLVLQAFATGAPDSMQEVARRYGELLLNAHQTWRQVVKDAAEKNLPAPAALPDPAQEELRQVLYAPDSPVRVPKGAMVDLEWFFDESTRVEVAKLQAEIDRWIIKSSGAGAYAVILADKPTQRNPRVFLRGNPANKGEEVPRRFLEVLAGERRRPFANGSGRMELAEAIASNDNPLTARVMVNRIWLHHFGAGLVKTPSDFGMRSERPSHPELLDWLARYFMDQGWSVKKLHRLILLSASYQQASNVEPAETTSRDLPGRRAANSSAWGGNPSAVSSPLDRERRGQAEGGNGKGLLSAQVDPENRLLWRFNRQRLDLESMRDSQLAVSGELDLEAGGKPVELFKRPFAPRRTIYGFIDRQFLPGVFRVFDFANPDMHSPQRPDTTVPQQALFFMNSPFVVERARALVERACNKTTRTATDRIEQLYRAVYQRPPTAKQIALGKAFIRQTEAFPAPEPPRAEASPWQYGYGEFDAPSQRIKAFDALPHFTGEAWQGGKEWPDATLGWVQLSAEGGHAGNHLQHAAIRRWTAPVDGKISIKGELKHEHWARGNCTTTRRKPRSRRWS
jgi:hypothetical protein